MKTAKQFSRQRTRHTFLLEDPAGASCNALCRLRGHGQPLSAHAKLSVPALAERPLRVSRVAASVVSIPTRIDLFLLMLSAAFFLPPKPTPEASSFRAFGPAQNRVAPALVLRSLRRRRIAGPLQRPETVLPSSLCELRRDKPHWFSGFFTRGQEISSLRNSSKILTFGLHGFWSRHPQHTSRGLVRNEKPRAISSR